MYVIHLSLYVAVQAGLFFTYVPFPFSGRYSHSDGNTLSIPMHTPLIDYRLNAATSAREPAASADKRQSIAIHYWPQWMLRLLSTSVIHDTPGWHRYKLMTYRTCIV